MHEAPNNIRRSRAQQVVSKARRHRAAHGNVQDLPTTRVERGEVEGQKTLTAIFSRKGGGKPDRLDLSFLLEFPGLTDSFANAILIWGRTHKQVTRDRTASQLRLGWFTYLAQSGIAEVALSQVNEQIMTGFKPWLQKQVKVDGKPFHPNSIRKQIGALRNVIRHVSGAAQWLDMVPAGPRGAARKTNPTEVLRFEELLMVMAAVEEEVLALRDRLQHGRRLLEQGRTNLMQGQTLCSSPRNSEEARADANLALVLAMLDLRYPGVIPDVTVIRADAPLLGDTVRTAIGSKKVAGYFYACPRDLVPLVLSIALATIFNAQTVLKLCWKNIDRNVDRLGNGRTGVQFDVSDDVEEEEQVEETEGNGAPLTKVTGDKPRAQRQLVRLLDPEARGPNQVSLNMVLDLLTEMTTRIRPHVIDPDQNADRVFLYVQEKMEKRPKSFSGSADTAFDITWQNGLRRFIAEHQLPDFTLKTIRATLLDYTQLFNRGDLEAARQVGNHGSRVITWTHYTSDLVKRLLQESVGETMLVRERWLQSDGKLDPRNFRQWTDKGCATPGWDCLDPFDSPRKNQKRGSLCTGYGECPDCPLAAARPKNPRNVMLYEALRRAIYRSVTRVTAAVWRERWAPVVSALDALLAHVPAKVLEESRRISVELPDVG